MPALVAGIHGLILRCGKGVDGRDEPGHDGGWVIANGRWYQGLWL
jgi:hypothetical protein